MIPIRHLAVPALFGGMNNIDDHLSIKGDEAFLIENCHIDSSGVAHSRRGSRRLSATALDGEVRAVFEYVKGATGGATTVTPIVVAGAKWYYYDATLGFTEIGSLGASTRPSLVNYLDGSGNDVVVLANGTDFKYYNGSSVTNITFTNSSAPRYLQVYDNRLAVSGCDDNPNNIYMSAALGLTFGVNDYFTLESDEEKGRIKGLGKVWSFLLGFKDRATYLITEGDPSSTTVQQIPVSLTSGAVSHWSIVVVRNYIFTADNDGFNVGWVNEATEAGMFMKRVSDKVERKFKRVKDFGDIIVVYDGRYDEIIWGARLKQSTSFDIGFVFNVGLSSIVPSGVTGEQRFVWSSYFKGSGYEPTALGLVTDSSTGRKEVWRGDASGFVYVMDENTQYTDNGSAIRGRIWLAPVIPGGIGVTKRFCSLAPKLFQKVNGSVVVRWVIDSMITQPDTDITIGLDGNIPYFNDGTDSLKREDWGNVTGGAHPMLPVKVDVMDTGAFIEPVFDLAGSNARDDMAYLGMDVFYQVLSTPRRT